MNLISEFLEQLDKLIISKKQEIKSNEKKIEYGRNQTNNDKKIVLEILDNIEDVDNIYKNIEILKKYTTESEINDIQLYIDLYNTLMNFLKDKFLQDNKENIYNIIKKASSRIKIIEVDKLEAENQKLQSEVNDIENLKRRINDYEITDVDMYSISKICSEIGFVDSKKLKLISTLILISMEKLYEKIDSEEVVEECEIKENEIEIPLKLLEELFDKHGIDFNLLSNSKKVKLQKFGNISNIDEILYLFDEYEIDINKRYNNGTIFTEIAPIINILIYTKAKDIKNTLEILKEYKMLENDNSLVSALKSTSIFISRRKKYKSKTIKKGPGNGTILSGAMEDFAKNIELIYSIYKDILKEINPDISEDEIKRRFQEEVYTKFSQFFAISNDKVKNIVKVFERYHIKKNSYINTLSSFGSVGYSSKLDEFIEIDCFDYIKDNLSKLTDRSQINTLVFARKYLGFKDEDMFKEKRQLNAIRTSDSKKVLQLNNINNALEIAEIDPKKMNPKGSYIPDNYIKVFEQLDKTVKKEFYDSENNFFDNYDLIVKNLYNKKYEYLNLLLDNIDPNNPLICRINNIPISINKILRIYSIYDNHSMSDSIDKLMYAITFNSHYTEEEVKSLEKELKEIKSKGRELK